MMKKAIGIDLGGTNLKAGILREDGKLLHLDYSPTEAKKGPIQVIQNINEAIEKLLKHAEGNKITGIGIGAPGQVDVKTGIVYDPPNLPGWHAENLPERMTKHFNLPAFVDNDANLGALAESVFGAGQDASYFVLVTLGTGVGSGIIFDKKIYHGAAGAAGEFGHMTIHYDGPRCNCGNKGCIERYIGAQWIVERALDYLSAYPNSALHSYKATQEQKINPKVIADLANQGDALCRRVIEETGNYLGIALGSLVNLLNLDLILIGGGISNAGPILYDAILGSLKGYSLSVPGATVKIRQAALSENAGVIGAAQLVFENLASRK